MLTHPLGSYRGRLGLLVVWASGFWDFGTLSLFDFWTLGLVDFLTFRDFWAFRFWNF